MVRIVSGQVTPTMEPDELSAWVEAQDGPHDVRAVTSHGFTKIEVRLWEALSARLGQTVDHHTLITAGWPQIVTPALSQDSDLLRVAISRMRPKVERLGLRLRSERYCGYVIEPVTKEELEARIAAWEAHRDDD